MPPVKVKGHAKPKNTKKVLKRLLSYMGKFKALWLLVFLCVALSAGAGVAGSYMLKPALNNYIIPLIKTENPDFSSLVKMLVALGIIFATGALATWVNSRIMLYISSTILFRIRTDLFQKIQKLPIKYYDAHPHGDVMSRFTNDTDTLRDMFNQTVPQLLSQSITIVSVFVMMLILSPLLTLVVVITISFMLFLATRIGKKSAAGFKDNQKNIGELNGYIEELIEGQKVVKVFNHETEVISAFNKLNDKVRTAGTWANSYANVLGPLMGNLSHIQYALVAITGAFLVISARMDLGTIAAFLQYTRSFSQPVSMISQLFNSILNALAGAERIFDAIDETDEIDEGRISLVNAYEVKGRLVQSFATTGTWAWKDSADNALTELKGEVIFDHVSFGYKENKLILHDISIHAKPGSKIALVGSTGSGKTTVTNLLTRFYDVHDGNGKIIYDSKPLNEIKKADLRRSLGMVLQDTHLFTGTIAENVKYGNSEASMYQIKKACELANADSFIKHLEKGYDTVITGDGAGLSQGQRQLLSIARAAVANPPVLILDEATSSIDTRTEKLIQDGMDRLMKGRTVFVIAHRLSTIRNADEIIVMEKGRIIERGNHDSLIALKGRYYQLCNCKTPSNSLK